MEKNLNLEVQTRSEEGEIRLFPSFKDAHFEAKRDPKIWKLSFSLPNGERVRLIRVGEEFVLQQIDDIMEAAIKDKKEKEG